MPIAEALPAPRYGWLLADGDPWTLLPLTKPLTEIGRGDPASHHRPDLLGRASSLAFLDGRLPSLVGAPPTSPPADEVGRPELPRGAEELARLARYRQTRGMGQQLVIASTDYTWSIRGDGADEALTLQRQAGSPLVLYRIQTGP